MRPSLATLFYSLLSGFYPNISLSNCLIGAGWHTQQVSLPELHTNRAGSTRGIDIRRTFPAIPHSRQIRIVDPTLYMAVEVAAYFKVVTSFETGPISVASA